MTRFSQDGTKHPTLSDVPDMEGIYHIGQCAECREAFPTWASMEEWARYSDPAGYEKVRAEMEARRP